MSENYTSIRFMGNIFQAMLPKDTSGWLLKENIAIPFTILLFMIQVQSKRMLGNKTFTITELGIQDLLKGLMEEVLLFVHSTLITQNLIM